MRNPWLSRLRAAAFGAALALLALYPRDAMEAARGASFIWANQVMPALFPFMVFSQILIGEARSAVMIPPLAMLGGSPAGARMIAQRGAHPIEAQRLAALCTTASPLFILGSLGGGFRMLIAHWLGAVLAYAFVWLITRADHSESVHAGELPSVKSGLPEAIRDAAFAMVTVCGCMVLFSVLTALILRLLPLSQPLAAFVGSIMEMASGSARIQALSLPEATAAPLLCAVVSFGGLSIFWQNAVFLRPAGVKLPLQLAARIVHALAAFLICSLFYLS